MSTYTKLSGAWLLKDMQALSPISVRHLSYEARCGYVLNPIEGQALARALDDVYGAKLRRSQSAFLSTRKPRLLWCLSSLVMTALGRKWTLEATRIFSQRMTSAKSSLKWATASVGFATGVASMTWSTYAIQSGAKDERADFQIAR